MATGYQGASSYAGYGARGAMDRADKAEGAYADKTRQMAETIIGQTYNDPGAVAAPLSLTPDNVAATAGGLKQGGDNKRYGDMARAMLGYTGGDLGAAMGAAQGMQSKDVENRRYAEGLAYRDKTDARRNFVDDRLFGAGREDATRQADQWEKSFNQDGSQFDATMDQNATQFGVTSGLSRDQLAEQRRQFDAELEIKKAEADAKTAAGGALFEGPALAGIYNRNMDALDTARGRQSGLDTIATASQQFIDKTKDGSLGMGFWAQGEGLWNDLAQGLSMDTTTLKSLTDRIAPLMREAGSGASSDRDIEMFKSAVVSINNTPEANKRFAAGAKAVAERNRDYVDFLNQAITPNDPQSRQKADALWSMYKDDQRLFDEATGEVMPAQPFDQWLAKNMGQQAAPAATAAPPVDEGESLAQKWATPRMPR